MYEIRAQIPHGKGHFDGGEWASHCKVQGHCGHLYKNAEPTQMSFGLWALMGPRNHVLDGGPDVLRTLPWQPFFLAFDGP